MKTPQDRFFKAWINPLQFLEVDQPWTPPNSPLPSANETFRFLCSPNLESDVENIVARYRQISVEKPRLFAVPAEDRILEKLVWPLRHAKASFSLGNYLGTISLCGLVSEMIAVLLFEMTDARLNNQPMEESDEEALFGRSFERLDQKRRIDVLKAYGSIDDEKKQAFDSIRNIRRKYLHLWSQDHDSLAGDAVTVFKAAVFLVGNVIGQDISADGKIMLNPALTKYLEKTGTYEPTEDSA